MRLSALFLAAAAALSATACVGPFAAGAAAPPFAGNYVALGASFAAGPGLGELKPGSPARCAQTMQGYPTLIAEQLRMALVDASCSGATTMHVLHGWKELPPQIDALTADTALVTVTVGGNDLNYVGNLFAASCAPDGTSQVAGRKFVCPEPRRPTEEQYAAVEANLREIASQVRTRAPNARLAFVTYLSLVPQTPCAAAPLSAQAVAISTEIADRLSAMTRRVAEEAGALLVPIDDESRLHTACDAEPWTWGARATVPGDGIAWHPNAAGMRATASAVIAALASRTR
ncbi:hypothetical protein B2G71_16695 [Novosphingobium sp. PC22D]|uniref:SGNH/GDSL hydrolase family protein n=1 Tax=Novosphingobium sp. PC22D TaxID=1962403 RepID=UPI000BF2315B|nr:SGNH/GDSL hydrolase family protein [Novosphingobium sp. PC22D]PEQ11470.1 hypothetical protein B2G71_16695 [Novosphingobium sp. PC22D]